jgi:hypothetical protein
MAYSSIPDTFLAGARPVRNHRHTKRRAHPALPDLEPAENGTPSEGRFSHLARIQADLAAQFGELKTNPDTRNPLARLTVYTLNAILLIVAFPVGFALLLVNVLLGENLRITVHVLALTGLALSLSSTDTVARVLGIG